MLTVIRTVLKQKVIAAIALCFGVGCTLASAWLPLVSDQCHMQTFLAAAPRKLDSGLYANLWMRSTPWFTGVLVAGVSTGACQPDQPDSLERLSWSELAHGRLERKNPYDLVGAWEFATGWPFRAVRVCGDGTGHRESNGLYWKSQTRPETWFGIVNCAGAEHPGQLNYLGVMGPDGVIPIRPLVWGMLFDTLGYAALFGLVYWAAGATRRAVRARKGGCPGCGYPMQGMTMCPECGAPRKA